MVINVGVPVSSDQVTLRALVAVVPRDAVDEEVTVCGVREKRFDGKLAGACDQVCDVGAVPVCGR